MEEWWPVPSFKNTYESENATGNFEVGTKTYPKLNGEFSLFEDFNEPTNNREEEGLHQFANQVSIVCDTNSNTVISMIGVLGPGPNNDANLPGDLPDLAIPCSWMNSVARQNSLSVYSTGNYNTDQRQNIDEINEHTTTLKDFCKFLHFIPFLDTDQNSNTTCLQDDIIQSSVSHVSSYRWQGDIHSVSEENSQYTMVYELKGGETQVVFPLRGL